jgi:hypothetical protein
MKMRTIIRISLLCALLQACALTDASIDAGSEPGKAIEGRLSKIEQQTFVLSELIDARPDTSRIGYKENMLGAKTADLKSEQPVTTLVMQTIKDAVVANGHEIGEQGIEISGSVTKFWLDTDTNFWSIDLICDIEVNLNFVDVSTNQPVYQSKYAGNYVKGFQTTWHESNWQVVIAGALNELAEEFVFDAELAEAIRQINRP